LILVGAVVVVYFQQQNIFDWYKLRNYTAPAPVAQLAADDTMTSYARRIFYVNAPALEGKVQFTQCKLGGEKSIVLGCYHGDQAGIFVLTVDDARLNGVEQVTSAHEMLHAAYDRLSSSERKQVDKELLAYYNHGLTDERVRQTIENYRTFEPNDMVNEMHSILGTEVGNLPAPLETYYKKYFNDRSKIVGFAAQYQAEFTSRETAVTSDDAQLKAWKTQIDSLQSDLTTRQKQLDSASASLQQLKTQGDTEAYNAGVPGFNALVGGYNTEVNQVRSLIDQYNQLVNDRNSVVLEAQQLTNEIDSSVAAPLSK
jgi:hypothetical protein